MSCRGGGNNSTSVADSNSSAGGGKSRGGGGNSKSANDGLNERFGLPLVPRKDENVVIIVPSVVVRCRCNLFSEAVAELDMVTPPLELLRIICGCVLPAAAAAAAVVTADAARTTLAGAAAGGGGTAAAATTDSESEPVAFVCRRDSR